MNQLRILQAVGLAVVCLIVGGIISGVLIQQQGISTETITLNQMITYFLPVQVIAQFALGFWLGRKVGGSFIHLFTHVFFANIVLFLFLVILGFLAGQNAFSYAAFTPLMALFLCIPSLPLALLVRRKPEVDQS
jgi:phosphoglycerol transferase MdoB-like AlkP superfamily enzyme